MYKVLFWPILIIPTVLTTILLVFTYLYFSPSLISRDTLINSNNTGVVLLDRDNRPFFTFYQGRVKAATPLSKVPQHTQQAVVAVEDRNFYHHSGFSFKAIFRSLLANIKSTSLANGGSTITQQLVKNALLFQNKTLVRKFQEIILAEKVESQFTKSQILEMYLNTVYFGEGAYGIEDAAQIYFGKHAQDLTLAESTMLVGLLRSPSKLSPISGDFALSKQRQGYVLSKMVEQGYITPEAKTKAESQELTFQPNFNFLNQHAPHFALMVRDELIRRFGEEALSKSGIQVKTTLDLDWQEIAQEAVSTQLKSLAKYNATNGSVVIIDPKTGEILSLVGSYSWSDTTFGKVNMAASPRPPGSSFKPIVYLAAFQQGVITPATILKDEPKTYPTSQQTQSYKPLNYDRKFRGPVLPRRSLANSLNVPSVEVLSKLGIPQALQVAKQMGISSLKSPSDYGVSLVLGPGEVSLVELTSAYSVFANSGVKNDPFAILEIQDKNGQVIYAHKPNPQTVTDPKYTFLISSILSDNSARQEAFGNALTISRPAAVKTGTSEDYKDSWTVGYTPSLAVGVWVGNNNNSPMRSVAGSLGAAPIWKKLMQTLLASSPVEKFEPPPGVVAKPICKQNGLLLKQATSSGYLEYFIEGQEPTKYCIIKKIFS